MERHRKFTEITARLSAEPFFTMDRRHAAQVSIYDTRFGIRLTERRSNLIAFLRALDATIQ